MYKVEVFIPKEYIEELRDELNKVGACRVGNYDNVMSIFDVRGYWRPLEGATPHNGEKGKINEGTECKVEFRCENIHIRAVASIIRKIHPYEEPLVNIIPVLTLDELEALE